MMDNEALRKVRGRVIEDSINLEIIMGAIICKYYLGEVKDSFFFDVLLDEHFSFGFKRRIIEKIVPMNERMRKKLERLNTIRNYFAHWGPKVYWGAGPPTNIEAFFIPKRHNRRKPLDLEALFEEFKEFEPEVKKHLFEFAEKLGVRSIPGPLKINRAL